jgi:TRAP-type C4-dicarboxylate transport system permease small subunit
MTIGVAIFLIAVGAILRYATNFSVQNVDMDTVGLILMIAGAAGLALAFLQEAIRSRQGRQDAVAEEERRQAAEQQRREPPPY